MHFLLRNQSFRPVKKTKTGDLHPIVFCNRLRSKQATDAVAFSLFPSIRYEIHFYLTTLYCYTLILHPQFTSVDLPQFLFQITPSLHKCSLICTPTIVIY